MDFLRISKRKFMEKSMLKSHGSVGADLVHLEADKHVACDPGLNKRRKTVSLIKENNSWGFTLQTYGVKHILTNEIEVMTYVDYIEFGGPAFRAGLRRGDVIVSINGHSMEKATHHQLVQKIRSCQQHMRLVVLFEDCSKKIELHERYMKLKRVLQEKKNELRELEEQEDKIIQPYYEAKGIAPLDWIRRNLYSISSDGDQHNIVNTLGTLANSPNCPAWLKQGSSSKGDKYSDPFDPDDSSINYIDDDSDEDETSSSQNSSNRGNNSMEDISNRGSNSMNENSRTNGNEVDNEKIKIDISNGNPSSSETGNNNAVPIGGRETEMNGSQGNKNKMPKMGITVIKTEFSKNKANQNKKLITKIFIVDNAKFENNNQVSGRRGSGVENVHVNEEDADTRL
ncbi:hypothetical protein ScPMuIL_017041 [Solemya velum]